MRGIHCDYCIHGVGKHIVCQRHDMAPTQEHNCLTIPQAAFPDGAMTLFKVFEAQRKGDVSEWMNSYNTVISRRPTSEPQIVLLEDDDYVAYHGHITQMIFVPAPLPPHITPGSVDTSSSHVLVKIPAHGGSDSEITHSFKSGDAIILQGGQKISAWRHNGRSPGGVCVITTLYELLPMQALENVVVKERWVPPKPMRAMPMQAI